MNVQLSSDNESAVASIEELSLVALTRSVIVSGDGRALPKGAIGVVVGVLKSEAACVVEFAEPFAALVDLDIVDLETA